MQFNVFFIRNKRSASKHDDTAVKYEQKWQKERERTRH